MSSHISSASDRISLTVGWIGALGKRDKIFSRHLAILDISRATSFVAPCSCYAALRMGSTLSIDGIVFWCAFDKRTGNRDKLRVWYMTSLLRSAGDGGNLHLDIIRILLLFVEDMTILVYGDENGDGGSDCCQDAEDDGQVVGEHLRIVGIV